jgi:hypothetical protein
VKCIVRTNASVPREARPHTTHLFASHSRRTGGKLIAGGRLGGYPCPRGHHRHGIHAVSCLGWRVGHFGLHPLWHDMLLVCLSTSRLYAQANSEPSPPGAYASRFRLWGEHEGSAQGSHEPSALLAHDWRHEVQGNAFRLPRAHPLYAARVVSSSTCLPAGRALRPSSPYESGGSGAKAFTPCMVVYIGSRLGT